MKKLYKKGKVHPTPPITLDYLSFLPPTILALTVVLSAEDKQVLAYLISCPSTNFSNNTPAACGGAGADHSASFNCNCFRCYMSYWVKWDASSNRQIIHEIIDAFEEGSSSLLMKNKKERRKRSKGLTNGSSIDLKRVEKSLSQDLEVSEPVYVEVKSTAAGCGDEVDGGGEEDISVKGFLNFLGGKFWRVLI